MHRHVAPPRSFSVSVCGCPSGGKNVRALQIRFRFVQMVATRRSPRPRGSGRRHRRRRHWHHWIECGLSCAHPRVAAAHGLFKGGPRVRRCPRTYSSAVSGDKPSVCSASQIHPCMARSHVIVDATMTGESTNTQSTAANWDWPNHQRDGVTPLETDPLLPRLQCAR